MPSPWSAVRVTAEITRGCATCRMRGLKTCRARIRGTWPGGGGTRSEAGGAVCFGWVHTNKPRHRNNVGMSGRAGVEGEHLSDEVVHVSEPSIHPSLACPELGT
ncbi:hypothetical protein AOLI_G00165660 [Acnodon oligacanthus]